MTRPRRGRSGASLGFSLRTRVGSTVSPSTAPAQAASSWRRLTSIGSPYSQAMQLAVPRRSIGTNQPAGRLGVTEDLIALRVPAELAAQAQRQVGQVARGGHAVGAVEV